MALCSAAWAFDSINPEQALAHDIFNVLKLTSAVKIEHFSRRNFEMVELVLAPDSGLCGMKLYRIREKKRAKSVIILGGGKTSYFLAKMLSTIGSKSVRIIEKDEAVCNELSAELPDTMVIQGDGTHRDLMPEEGLLRADAFIALSRNDEENILAFIFASSVDVPKIITSVKRGDLIPMAAKLGLETIVSTSDSASDTVLGFARALENTDGSNIETLYKLMDGKAEALEFSVSEIQELTKIPSKSLKFKKNLLIAGIIRGRRAIIPSGDDMIMPGDRVVVLTSEHKLYDLTDALA